MFPARLLLRNPRIFISYRHKSKGSRDFEEKDALARELQRVFGEPNVFLAGQHPGYGEQFPEKLKAKLAWCDVQITLISRNWLGPTPEGNRINEESDWLRMEVEDGIKRKNLIPVLCGDTALPPATELPESLWTLHQIDTTPDIQRIIDAIIRKTRPYPIRRALLPSIGIATVALALGATLCATGKVSSIGCISCTTTTITVTTTTKSTTTTTTSTTTTSKPLHWNCNDVEVRNEKGQVEEAAFGVARVKCMQQVADKCSDAGVTCDFPPEGMNKAFSATCHCRLE
jgi:hypothetical protein